MIIHPRITVCFLQNAFIPIFKTCPGFHVFFKCIDIYSDLRAKKISQLQRTIIKSVMFFFPTGFTTHCGFVFCSPQAGYSLLEYEVS